jgi:antitoxin (DNA-binding transcriptional repressor) of toxin-antitoxin stability system
MVTISADEMQKDLPNYLRLVQTGETLVITQADEPVAELKPIMQVAHEPRPSGLCAGEFVVPDDFDAPLPDDIVDTFAGQ